MQYGVSLPNFGPGLSARVLAGLARDAEAAGWDGFFLWDHLLAFAPGPVPVVDPWIALTAIAAATVRIRLGPLVTPLPRRRPTQLARETVAVDQLSSGRLTLGVGLGALPYEWDYLGEEPDLRTRGQMLDEGLAVLTGLWTGAPFRHQGAHYRIGGHPPDETWSAIFAPPPVQRPRIPIWVAGTWPKRAPLRRAARWDGVCPIKADGALTPEEVRELVAFIRTQRTSAAPFDVVISGATSGEDPAAGAQACATYRAAGATWWIEDLNPWRFGWSGTNAWPDDAIRARIGQGPPRA